MHWEYWHHIQRDRWCLYTTCPTLTQFSLTQRLSPPSATSFPPSKLILSVYFNSPFATTVGTLGPSLSLGATLFRLAIIIFYFIRNLNIHIDLARLFFFGLLSLRALSRSKCLVLDIHTILIRNLI